VTCLDPENHTRHTRGGKFEPRTLGYQALRFANCATSPEFGIPLERLHPAFGKSSEKLRKFFWKVVSSLSIIKSDGSPGSPLSPFGPGINANDNAKAAAPAPAAAAAFPLLVAAPADAPAVAADAAACDVDAALLFVLVF
jgi:hypothetical protein